MYDQPYVPPTVTVDGVVFQLEDGVLSVALIQRGNEPFKGEWALPGGYNAAGETTSNALQRIVLKKSGIDLRRQAVYTEQLFTFDTVARDPRGHAVSITYLACGRNIVPEKAQEKTAFFPVKSLPKLAYDHANIIEYAHERLASKLSYTNVVFSLLPKTFTLTKLQSAYEAIFGHELDKRNFRKKFMQLEMIEETGDTYREGAHRPAKLYRFKKQSLQTLERSFD